MSTTDVVKALLTLAKEANRLDLAEDLVELRREALDLKEENAMLREQIKSLEEKVSLQSKVVFEKGIYWVEEDEMTRDKSKTPICPRCWDVDRIVVRQALTKRHLGLGFRCSNCNNIFHV